MERDRRSSPPWGAGEVEGNAAVDVLFQRGEECLRGGRAVGRAANKCGGGAAVVERPLQRGVRQTDVVAIEASDGHRGLVCCLQRSGRLVDADAGAEGTHQLTKSDVQVLGPSKHSVAAGENSRGLDSGILRREGDIVKRGEEGPGASGEGGHRLGDYEFRSVAAGGRRRGRSRGNGSGGRHGGGRQDEREAKEGGTANLCERRGGSQLGKYGAHEGESVTASLDRSRVGRVAPGSDRGRSESEAEGGVGGAHGMRAEGGISTVRGGSSKSGRRNGCAWTRRAGGRTSRATRGPGQN